MKESYDSQPMHGIHGFQFLPILKTICALAFGDMLVPCSTCSKKVLWQLECSLSMTLARCCMLDTLTVYFPDL